MSHYTPKAPTAKTKKACSPIDLFQREDDPQSHAVRQKLSDLGLDFMAHTVPKGKDLKHQKLIEAGGSDKVPFLVDHASGTKLHGSSTIVTYLEAEYGKKPSHRWEKFFRQAETRAISRVERFAWIARGPLDRVQKLKGQLSDSLETIRGSARVLSETFTSALSRASEGGSQGAEEEEVKGTSSSTTKGKAAA
jgi:glutathione S-transferase